MGRETIINDPKVINFDQRKEKLLVKQNKYNEKENVCCGNIKHQIRIVQIALNIIVLTLLVCTFILDMDKYRISWYTAIGVDAVIVYLCCVEHNFCCIIKNIMSGVIEKLNCNCGAK